MADASAPAGRSSLTTFTLVAGGMVLLVYGLQGWLSPDPEPTPDETAIEGSSPEEEARLAAEAETRAADLCIVLGSSLVVYPAAGFPEMAKRQGAKLVIVNNEETGLDDLADLVIRRGIGDVMGGAVGVN